LANTKSILQTINQNPVQKFYRIHQHNKRESRNTEFHKYKSKQERNFGVILKHIHVTANLDEIKKEIGDLGHTNY
jgi:hypothetical protein